MQLESNKSEGEGRNNTWQKNPTFMLWDFTLRNESLILIFDRANRGKNFSLYVKVLKTLHLYLKLFKIGILLYQKHEMFARLH